MIVKKIKILQTKTSELPLLLVPLFPVYIIACIASSTLAILIIVVPFSDNVIEVPKWFSLLMLDIGIFIIYLLVLVIMGHYVYLSVNAVLSSVLLSDTQKKLRRTVESLCLVCFSFAAIHYFIALFSNQTAYYGIKAVAPDSGWKEHHIIIDKLVYIPDVEQVTDFIYFSIVTLTTVGYGDIHPLTVPAKIASSIEMLIGFGIIVLVISRIGSKQNI